MQEAGVVVGFLLPADEQPPGSVQPGMSAFDFPTPRAALTVRRFRGFVGLTWDMRKVSAGGLDKLQLDALDRSHDELGELASRVFELSQTLRVQWVVADYAAKRRILEIVCLNCTLDGVSLKPEMRKPFDALAEGLISPNSREFRTPVELFLASVAEWEPHILRLVMAA